MNLRVAQLAFVLTLSGAAHQAFAVDPAKATHPVRVEVSPRQVSLKGSRSGQQLLVTAYYADGAVRDLTHQAKWSLKGNAATLKAAGYVTAKSDGECVVHVEHQGLKSHVTVAVTATREHHPISFRREFMPVLSAAGCSDIRCHGAPSGKSEFRLSLWGFDPAVDLQQLTRAGNGRRTNAFSPEQSLIFLKAVGRLPHVGRQRFKANSAYAEIFRAWQREGLKDDNQPVRLRRLVVRPHERVLRAPAASQQLAVLAEFDDGSVNDVTRLTNFATTEPAIATVSREGLVEFQQQGEVAILCRFLGELTSVRLMHIAPPPQGFRWSAPAEHNYIDRHVFAKLRMLNIQPSELCTEEEFVRRVYLDLCGRLPTPNEVQRFASNNDVGKRSQLIEQLLQRPEFADLWTKKWMDLLRSSRDSIQLAGARAYHEWLRGQIAVDESMANVTRELLTSTGKSYSAPAANYYCTTPLPRKVTDPYYLQKDMAESTAQLFLGVRLQCAQCHNHPYERWTQRDYLSLAAFFTQVKRTRLGKAGPSGRPDRRQIEVSLNAKGIELKDADGDGAVVQPRLFGESPTMKPDTDRRKLLAAWLTKKDNPFFAKAIVNRVWFHLNGRGIVDPVDDFRDSNPPANSRLLDALADDFVRNGFRLKPLIRAIVSSRTYQLSAKTNGSNKNDTRYFSRRMPQPLSAEVLLDAISDVTDVPEKFEITKDYLVGIPNGTVKLPAGTRAVQLPVNDIVTLINVSGKYVRYESHPFLRTFGQPNRTQTCECDREQTFSRKQALELIVGPLVSGKIAQPNNRLGTLLAADQDDRAILRELYLRAVSRRPTTEAETALLQHLRQAGDRRQAWEDVLWTILNSQEFIFQH